MWDRRHFVSLAVRRCCCCAYGIRHRVCFDGLLDYTIGGFKSLACASGYKNDGGLGVRLQIKFASPSHLVTGGGAWRGDALDGLQEVLCSRFLQW